MAELTLKDLIRLEEPNVDNLKIKIARHVMKGRGWEGHADPHVTLKVYSHFVKGMEVQIEEYMEKLG
ncbi:hypothetical protein N9803_06540 [Gammaproteobacteria bacterium]|nr:hypothetical protein [Gammaproteobacteria bacterium]